MIHSDILFHTFLQIYFVSSQCKTLMVQLQHHNIQEGNVDYDNKGRIQYLNHRFLISSSKFLPLAYSSSA